MYPSRYFSDFDSLKLSLRTTTYERLLRWVQNEDVLLPYIEQWEEIVPDPQTGRRDPNLHRSYLASVHDHYSQDGNPLWRTVLLALSWHDLLWQWRKHIRDDKREKKRLWLTVLESFIEAIDSVHTVSSYPVTPTRLMRETHFRIRTQSRRLWRDKKRFKPNPFEDAETNEFDRVPAEDAGVKGYNSGLIADPRSMRGFAEVELKLYREARLRFLQYCLSKGWITEVEYHLQVGVEIYGKSIKEFNDENSGNYETTRKRFQRLQEKLPRFEKRCPGPWRQLPCNEKGGGVTGMA